MSKKCSWSKFTLALLAISCGACASPGASATPEKARAAPTSPAAATPATARSVEATWQAGPLPMSVIVTNLRAHHLNKWAPAYLRDSNATSTSKFVYTLKLQRGHLILLSKIDGVTRGVQDREDYTVTGDRITISPINAGCGSTFAWQVTGSHLTLSFVKDTCAPYKGTPDEVYIRALYSSAAFTKTTP